MPQQDTNIQPADFCRQNGWDVGQYLVGDEGYGPTVIRITAIGEHSILARAVRRYGEPRQSIETTWTLACRDWQPCQPDGSR